MDPDEFDVALARKLGRPVTRERVITVDRVSRIESTTADPDGTVTKRCVQLAKMATAGKPVRVRRVETL
jgi:hypothetical protein